MIKIVKLHFNFFEDFLDICQNFKPVFNEQKRTYRGLPVKDCMNAVFVPQTNSIHVNLTAYRNDEDIISNISQSIQHEHLHYCILDIVKTRNYTIKAEETIVSYILDYDYPLEVFK